MVFPYDNTLPKYKFYQTVVHRYSTNRPVVPVTSHQVYTQNFYDNSASNLITTYIFLILFLSLCYRLIDKAFFQGRLISSIFGFDEEDIDSRVETEPDDIDYGKSDDEDSYNYDDSEEKEEQGQKPEKVTLESPDNAEIDMSS
ncbi:hypothetical protein, conserved [Plasmodium vivax]|uniref:Uncharacterized protein n=6 Tax=Plasmodium vivax TaxID=5855 RepID=A5K8G8_PLAVS|nr:hypothetical protein PVX_083555 [Plasmodium vivax]KMZ79136.1 hypothetical protein PVIIG_01610 [Plasmodium vivax India VII]KMZ85282.1 hypothetical protein PVBG_01968 [Plasmodium vivax Brazil I]KMZ91158.1 hypothetical protein PVMG_00032 [Plasmodium vivax Mauritania I]KMZ98426.1 hypothetical protein PVNG_04370 [Plasmodium vivax North Korean]EDL44582.1 hypothetical protein PVX_083555 [Plasmodium vivax]|eukprot:XP_001614309.1 hypothetical protein [Plasmodium vivax Sal-1]